MIHRVRRSRQSRITHGDPTRDWTNTRLRAFTRRTGARILMEGVLYRGLQHLDCTTQQLGSVGQEGVAVYAHTNVDAHREVIRTLPQQIGKRLLLRMELEAYQDQHH